MNEKLIKDFINAVKSEKKKPSPYDTSAKVVRVDGGTAWVHIAGGIDETPVKMTTSAKVGDEVQVRVSGGRAFIIGNATSPPTDDTQANKATKKAEDAQEKASNAIDYAEIAKTASEQAEASAAEAKATTDIINGYAEEVDKSVKQILIDGETAGVAAHEAETSAETANSAASSALTGLSMVENVVGVLNWVSTHATYQLTADETVVDGKWYFTYDAVNDRYTVVNNPTGDPSAQGFYEIVNIDEAVQDYLVSHLALDSNGLWLQTDNVNSKLLLSNTDGLVIYGNNGPLAKYGTDAVIGKEDGFHIKIDGTEIGFYQVTQKVAYINGNKLYITKSVVLQQMDVGEKIANGGLGQWSWRVHPTTVNGNTKNNLYLKWLG